MLTKRRLEDAVKCNIACSECSLLHIGYQEIDCIPVIAQTALAYRAMLERLEYIPDEFGGHCAICGMGNGLGHTEECELAALLKESEGLR